MLIKDYFTLLSVLPCQTFRTVRRLSPFQVSVITVRSDVVFSVLCRRRSRLICNLAGQKARERWQDHNDCMGKTEVTEVGLLKNIVNVQ